MDRWDRGVDFEISPMVESDLEEVLRIEATSFTNPWTEEMFRRELKGSSLSFPFVARRRSLRSGSMAPQILGYICLWVVGQEMEIANLAVHPLWRRKGIGRELMKYGLRFGRKKGARWAYLEVRASNAPAQELYRQLGFEVIGVRERYYQLPPEDALIMALDIDRKSRGVWGENRLDK